MPAYCSYSEWLKNHDKQYLSALEATCIVGNGNDIRCNTLIVPNSADSKKLSGLGLSGDRHKRKEFIQKASAMMLRVNVSDPTFKPGVYANNLVQGVKISAPANGKFTIHSGKGFGTKGEISIRKDFEADLQFKRDDPRHMCVCELVSGDIAIDGEAHNGARPTETPMEGGSEIVHSDCSTKVQAWSDIIATTETELTIGCPVAEAQVRLCGLMQHIILESEKIEEYKSCADIVHTALSFEPLAALYVLMQPYSDQQLMHSRLNDDWAYAPFLCEEPKGLYDKFASMFPSKIDKSKRDSIIASIKESIGVNKLYNLQDMYNEKCAELFSDINYPVHMKLWCDEVSYYITTRMKEIRKNKDVGAFRDLCESLARIYPGKNHKSESIINSDEYWSGFDKSREVKGVSEFIDSFCCFQCCHEGGSLSSECSSHLIPVKPSAYLKSLLYLNK